MLTVRYEGGAIKPSMYWFAAAVPLDPMLLFF
jgi:hypothetical protein